MTHYRPNTTVENYSLGSLICCSMPGANIKALLLAIFVLGSCHRGSVQTAPKEIDQDIIEKSVASIGALVASEYFDAEVGKRIHRSLRQRLAEGAYSGLTTADSLAKRLTDDLVDLAHDKHLAVGVVQPATSKSADDSRAAQGKRSNWGLQRVEILDGNVGYLKLNHFYRLSEARETISAAMCVLQNAEALIVDLRDNDGGTPATVAFLASYFLGDKAIDLFDLADRSGGVRSYSTDPSPLRGRDAARPIYVLTSNRTFSGGEGMAFILQEQQRAEVVGEKTAGAANGGRPFPVNAWFEVTIPTFQVRGAVSGQNWEGTGVKPDVTVSASDAPRTAHIRALRELLRQSSTVSDRDSLRRTLDLLEPRPD
jgi:retinol-binding protein 3